MKIRDNYGRLVTEDGKLVITFISPAAVWPLPHNQGRRPTSIRTLVTLPASSDQYEIHSEVRDIDDNTSEVTHGANYEGQAILAFA